MDRKDQNLLKLQDVNSGDGAEAEDECEDEAQPRERREMGENSTSGDRFVYLSTMREVPTPTAPLAPDPPYPLEVTMPIPETNTSIEPIDSRASQDFDADPPSYEQVMRDQEFYRKRDEQNHGIGWKS